MGWRSWGGDEWRPYVSVAQRRANAMREMDKLRRKGHPVAPVVIEGRAIARTFWGQAWCQNLERYSDYENRLPRGRTYVRNGSVVDLQIAAGEVTARVAGSELYEVKVRITPLPKARWKAVCAECAGGIHSLVELLQGRFGKGVMERMCEPGRGLFPAPGEITLRCSCPDWAGMCKHVAAVLYGVGARLDEKPELLFRLRDVDESELVAVAGKDLALAAPAQTEKVLEDDGLGELFGLDLGAASQPPPVAPLALENSRSAGSAAESDEAARPSRGRGQRRGKGRAPEPTMAQAREASEAIGRAVRGMVPRGRTDDAPDAGPLAGAMTHDELRAAVAREVRAALAQEIAILEGIAAFLGEMPGARGRAASRRGARPPAPRRRPG